MADRKTAILAVFVLSSLSCGIAGQYFWPGIPLSVADYAFAVLGSFLIFVWYHVDAKQRGYRRPAWLDAGIILAAVVAMPYYLFRTRGFRRGLVSTALGLLLMIVTGLLTGIGKLAIWYALRP